MPEADLSQYDWKAHYSWQSEDDILNDFYIPALCRSVRYDRKAGFFSSSVLVTTAKGLARLIRRGGRMRLLVGAELSSSDVEAIERGHKGLLQQVERTMLSRLEDPESDLARARLEALAWLIAEGKMEIKVVVPADQRGTPLPRADARGIFHEKVGIFIDEEGRRVAFRGSINESHTALEHNMESLSVFRSWDPSLREHVEPAVREFEQLWSDEAPRAKVLPVPEAVRKDLLRFRPDSPPQRDPAELTSTETDEMERLQFRFLADAPYIRPHQHRLGTVSAAVTPWPHQEDVVNQALQKFPERYLLCDEVGLGKTIEAALIIRELWIRGIIKRCLILVPAAVMIQWQEELWEKTHLSFWRYDESALIDPRGNKIFPDTSENPWNTADLMLASTQLARMSERIPEVQESDPWDLLLVDEAHHARRRPGTSEFEPNNLMRLLMGMTSRTRGMLLLTATPMQLHPREVWDLLLLVGMGGRWGASEDDFIQYFETLKNDDVPDALSFLSDMLRDHLLQGGEVEEQFVRQLENAVGFPTAGKWKRTLDNREVPSDLHIGLENNDDVITDLFRLHTPVRRHMFRKTRALLEEYHRRGLLEDGVPKRVVRDRFICMSAKERSVYKQIEDYIRNYYRLADRLNRGGLQFVLATYRRRLTSSIHAMERTLARRIHSVLEGAKVQDSLSRADRQEMGLYDEWDELRQEEAALPIEEERELNYLNGFIEQLRNLAADSKFEQLKVDLARVMKCHPKAIIFTQYTDTLDMLRSRLLGKFGQNLACYSGRGGEVWDGTVWENITKEEIKQRFADDEFRILLCTDAASEGLNLQTCGVLINFDMPWNPMKVEQRIGRIDRIGQRFAEVQILNYFYEETIEAKIWRRLRERIEDFHAVVGPLRPILEEAVRHGAGLTAQARSESDILQDFDEDLQHLVDEYLEWSEFAEGLAEWDSPDYFSPVMPEDIEQLFSESQLLRKYGELRCNQHSDSIFTLGWRGDKYEVTFDPKTYERHAGKVKYLSYGDSLFAEIVEALAGEVGQDHKIRRCVDQREEITVIRYHATDATSETPVVTWQQLQDFLQDQPLSDAPSEETSIDAWIIGMRERTRQRLDNEESRVRLQLQSVLKDMLALDMAYNLPEDYLDELTESIPARGFLQHQRYKLLLKATGASVEKLAIPSSKVEDWRGVSQEEYASNLGVLQDRAKRLISDLREVHVASKHLLPYSSEC